MPAKAGGPDADASLLEPNAQPLPTCGHSACRGAAWLGCAVPGASDDDGAAHPRGEQVRALLGSVPSPTTTPGLHSVLGRSRYWKEVPDLAPASSDRLPGSSGSTSGNPLDPPKWTSYSSQGSTVIPQGPQTTVQDCKSISKSPDCDQTPQPRHFSESFNCIPGPLGTFRETSGMSHGDLEPTLGVPDTPRPVFT